MPSSVVAKTALSQGRLGGLLPDLDRLRGNLGAEKLLTVLVLVVMLSTVAALRRDRRPRATAAAIALSVAAALHFAFGAIGWFERYQAYLHIGGFFVLAELARDLVPRVRARWMAPVLLCVLLVAPIRKYRLITLIPSTAGSIFRQQGQMARFFATQYDGEAIALNDLGAVAFAHRGPLLDLAGLGSYEVLRARKERRFDREFVEDVVKRNGVGAVAVYAGWFEETLPASWRVAGVLRLNDGSPHFINDTVTFFGTDEAHASVLRERLRRFAPTLPDGVEIETQ
jgi:hypothetical protein